MERITQLVLSYTAIKVIKSITIMWAKHVAVMTQMTNYTIFMGDPQRDGPFGRSGRSGRRWEDSVKMYLRETGFGNMDWFRVA
jgi:hypothetical protein